MHDRLQRKPQGNAIYNGNHLEQFATWVTLRNPLWKPNATAKDTIRYHQKQISPAHQNQKAHLFYLFISLFFQPFTETLTHDSCPLPLHSKSCKPLALHLAPGFLCDAISSSLQDSLASIRMPNHHGANQLMDSNATIITPISESLFPANALNEYFAIHPVQKTTTKKAGLQPAKTASPFLPFINYGQSFDQS